MKSADLREEAAPPSVQEAQAALKAAREAERERKKQLEREREEERRARTELLKQAQAVVAGVRQQCDDAVSFAEQNPPHPNHFHRTVCRSYLRGTLVAPDAMDTAEGRVVLGDDALAARWSRAHWGSSPTRRKGSRSGPLRKSLAQSPCVPTGPWSGARRMTPLALHLS
jgi:hypothetical protein